MNGVTKSVKLSRFGFTGKKKKIGVNYWRFFFNGVEKDSSVEQCFYIELEMLNPHISPDEVQLGFKTRVSLTAEDLQYTLAGTKSAQNLQNETLVQPSYCVLRAGKLGKDARQLAVYFPVSDFKFYSKPFGIEFANNLFSDEYLKGSINVTEESLVLHPEYLCNSGSASWNLSYEYLKDSDCGYTSASTTWFPTGIKTGFKGTFVFDGVEYIVNSKKSYGYVDRFWGKDFPKNWFHLSSNSLTSIISGSALFDSAFAVQGVFDNRISFVGNIEGEKIDFCTESGKGKYVSTFECTQAPESENPDENLLHWTVSINNKQWIIDIDIYCKISSMYNRKMEMPEGKRTILNILESGSGSGELKLYRKNGKNLEQVENATITKAICQYGQIDCENL